MPRNKVGRPVKITAATVGILEEAFRNGATVSEACSVSGISRDTFYKHFNASTDFSDKMERARSWLSTIAKRNLATAISSGDIKASVWYMERRNTLPGEPIAEEIPKEYTEAGIAGFEADMEQYVQYRIKRSEQERQGTLHAEESAHERSGETVFSAIQS